MAEIICVIGNKGGTGKTTLSRLLLEQLPENARIALVLNPRQNAIELLETICEELRIDISGDKFSRGGGSAKALVDAGADAIFPEAMRSLAEFEAMRAAIDVPLLANMTEFGKSELFSSQQLADVGINIVIWPVSMLRIAMGATGRALDTLNEEGHLTAKLGEMQHRAELYDLIDYEAYNRFDHSVFDLSLIPI